ncbi:FtsX-like permease family protein [Quadrisphaera sp. DSM 44207]|uniref:FtsX-like permease family protein n=1 Tax=Quadrisphaera sp. DSM 44207 TaxID=1881057 RepID=UPI0008833428|nr:ABC transporter permease [Quadrisphaera sp. DSM 44207]SDQ40822.1 putative ABC transport system permease protein [Quadrisphaera sp. DSM 44207]
MLTTTWRLSAGSRGRLLAAGLAIVLGTAFVTAVLLGSGLLQRTASASVAAGYAGADVVVTGQPLDEAAVSAVRALPGAAGADGRASTHVELLAGGRSQYASVTGVPSVPALRTSEVLEGALPEGPGGLALGADVAERLGAGVGDDVLVRTFDVDPAGGAVVHRDEPAVVTGLLAVPGGPASGLAPALAAPEQVLAWAGDATGEAGAPYEAVHAVAAEGTSPEELRAQVAGALEGRGAVARTAEEQARVAVDSLTSGTDVLTGAVLAFAVLALFVAGLVITNTLAVLVAQRTRQLALLRCVGATRRQVRAGVLAEALATGLLASSAGVAVGTGLAAAAAAVLSRAQSSVPVPGSVEVTATSVAVPVALGVLATLLAALAPARAATAVAPLAALRPPQAPDLRTRASRWRAASAALLVASGAALLGGGLALSPGGSGAGLLLALGGGMLSFTGVLLGAVLVVPRAVGALGRLAALVGGGPARVAAANAVRDPRRTATTTSALLIGVTLVSCMAVGAASTQATLDEALDEQWPVDVSVSSAAAPPTALEAALVRAVGAVDGVERAVGLAEARADVVLPGGAGAEAADLPVRGVDPAAARAVVASPAALAPLADGVVVVPEALAADLGITSGQDLAISTAQGAGAAAGTAPGTVLRAQVTPLPGDGLVATAADLAALDPQAPTTRLWLRLDADADAVRVVDAVQDAVSRAPDAAVLVEGSAAERAGFEQVIDTMLLVVVALLAVAVLIALIGVANTLSLSVLERTRESALLRALGLTRRQLRGMLALEGALVAGVGALLGVGLGTLYGWVGTAAVLGDAVGDGPAALAVPWAHLGAVLAVAVAAGLLASVLPGRRAARTPPAAALAG